MKVEEAAKYLKIGRTHCYELIRGGHLPTVQLGRLIRVSRKRLDQWIDEGGMRVK
ncbi:MAG: helix-turn-helix domain-containing protein [Chloroflexota bacterium]|nr:helix-turn-helix domain-containing protein [Chloroflexota bacterium]